MKGNGKVILWAVVITLIVLFVIKKAGGTTNIPVVSTLANNL